MPEIHRLLVANRGEIALRVMRSARKMGITTIAIYSEADVHAPHARFADEAYCIGPAASSESYLRGDKIIELCLENKIDAIHPGYGFLSENADFSRAAEAAGIIFVGPSAESMEKMGDKLSAKQAVKSFDVPLVPGVDHAVTDLEEARQIANQIGFPVLIKASAGGGGKGMRIVEHADEFQEQMERAVSEAVKAFGNGAVFVEKYVSSPRHIEIQVLADKHGNYLYLFERECSIQRRHQKVVEEAPSSVLSPELRKQMGEAAVNVCRACDYVNAGTVEFLLDADHKFYFLEMNTRLQVEHPVTEMITGLDLVQAQLEVAMGKPLAISQDDLKIQGHAIEIRVYAEDPWNKFLPDIGTLHIYRPPEGPGIRLDGGYEEGMDIPIYYDPMLAKLIVHAEDRTAALAAMIDAIDNFEILGVQTTLAFCRYVMEHEAFVSGNFDTHFVKDYFSPEKLDELFTEERAMVVALVGETALRQARAERQEARQPLSLPLNPWTVKRG